jgi:fumarate reductase subunit D
MRFSNIYCSLTSTQTAIRDPTPHLSSRASLWDTFSIYSRWTSLFLPFFVPILKLILNQTLECLIKDHTVLLTFKAPLQRPSCYLLLAFWIYWNWVCNFGWLPLLVSCVFSLWMYNKSAPFCRLAHFLNSLKLEIVLKKLYCKNCCLFCLFILKWIISKSIS